MSKPTTLRAPRLIAGAVLVGALAAGIAATASALSSDSGVATATKRIATYVTKPTPIPVSVPLKQRPTGKEFVFVQCGVPECAALAANLKEAGATMGVKITIISAGASAKSTQDAFASAAQKKPAVVLEAGIPAAFWANQLKQLKAQGTPVVVWAIPEPPGNGITAEFNGTPRFAATGRRMADYIISKSKGKARVAFFYPPEYAVFASEAAAFQSEMKSLCPSCGVEIVKAPATTIGSQLPGRVVSYLQQKPDTTWVAGAFGSVLIGVPQALQAAGLNKVQTITQAGGKVNFSYIKAGQQTVDLSNDLHIEAWLGLDVAARLATGQPVPANFKLPATSTPQLFIRKENSASVKYDATGAWISFPNYRQYFKKLWGVR